MQYMSKLEKKGELQLRTFVQTIYKNPSADPEAFAAASAKLAEQYHADKLGVFGIKPSEINNVKVIATMLDGKFTYKARDKTSRLESINPYAYLASTEFFHRYYCGVTILDMTTIGDTSVLNLGDPL